MTSPFRSTAVVGAGAVGGFFGAMLARAGHAVTLIARQAHVQAIEREGLRLQMAGKVEAIASPPAPTSPRCAAPTSSSSASSRRTPRPWRARWRRTRRRRARPQPAERRRERGDDRAPRSPGGRAGGGLRRHGDARAGLVAHHGRGDLVIGPIDAEARRTPRWPQRLQAIVDLFASAQVPVRISADVMAELWSKLMVNCAYNAISGIAQAALRQAGRARRGARAAGGGGARGRRARRAEGVDLPLAPRSSDAQDRRRDAGAALSTAQDMARGKPSEIDHLNGFVAPPRRRARRRHAGEPGAVRARPADREHARPRLMVVAIERGAPDGACVPNPAVDAVDVPAEFAQALRELGLADVGERLVGAPLAGGVSSDIWRIDSARGTVCAKRALAKLRVAADWRAPSTATATRRAGSRSPTKRRRARRRACSASTRASASSS
jgi:2-dehydropantoate 2-reductase